MSKIHEDKVVEYYSHNDDTQLKISVKSKIISVIHVFFSSKGIVTIQFMFYTFGGY